MKHYHFMGIGGVGMSALASLLVREGHQVSGCDLVFSELVYRLQGEGAQVFRGHLPKHLDGVDILVASTAIHAQHPELQEALRRGIPVLRRVQLLSEILSRGHSIGVTGSHGKTTVTSMLGSVFVKGGVNPMIIVGGEMADLGGNIRFGSGVYRIAEVDESDQLFQHLRLELAIFNNLEDDHVSPGNIHQPNYHASFEVLCKAARTFAANAGQVVYNADWPVLEQLTEGLPRTGFGLQKGSFQAVDVKLLPWGSSFTLMHNGLRLVQVELSVPGLHNVENALAVLTTTVLEGLDPQAAAEALRAFRGARRRLERVGIYHHALVVDDYAHHPTEVRATLEAARRTGLRIRVVFQPHRYLRTQQHWQRFAKVLELADEALILEVYPAGEEPIEGVSGALIAERLQATGHKASFVTWEQAADTLTKTAASGEMLLTMGAGNVWKLGVELIGKIGTT